MSEKKSTTIPKAILNSIKDVKMPKGLRLSVEKIVLPGQYKDERDEIILYRFKITIPNMKNYEFSFLRLQEKKLVLREKEELFPIMMTDFWEGKEVIVYSEKVFIKEMDQIFNSDEFKKMVSSLVDNLSKYRERSDK